jgi:hypothetical protein
MSETIRYCGDCKHWEGINPLATIGHCVRDKTAGVPKVARAYLDRIRGCEGKTQDTIDALSLKGAPSNVV